MARTVVFYEMEDMPASYLPRIRRVFQGNSQPIVGKLFHSGVLPSINNAAERQMLF